MGDSKQIKSLGLRFAHALHMTVKTAIIFTIQHKSVERPVQQSFQFLNHLLKETGQFTFGFVDNQVLLNNLLTSESSLRPLETEFLKRGIAAVTFEPGLSLARYKKIIGLLTAPTKVIEEGGGLLLFLDQHQVEGARILPAAKNQRRDENGDTIIESDSEAYVLSKQVAEEPAPRDLLDSLDALLQSACFDPSMRAEIFSSFASRGIEGSGFGVPISVPKLAIVKEEETGEVVENGPRSNPDALAADRSSLNPLAAHGPGLPGQPNSPAIDHAGFWSYASQAMAVGNWGTGSNRAPTLDAKPESFMQLVETSVERSLLAEQGNPEKSYTSLARILRTMGADKILAQFPAERREKLSGLSPEQMAAEYIEDTAFSLAATKLQSEGQSGKLLIDEEVVRVLVRSLQATHRADRLAQKLAQFVQDFAVPASIQEKIAEELRWTALNASQKYARLMELEHYSTHEFRRLMNLLRELVAQREMEPASALASHYFEFLDQANAPIQITELGRIPELIRSVPLLQVGFATKTAERLGRALLREDLPELLHWQLANALTVLSQSIAAFEAFPDVLAIGAYLENSQKRNPEKHAKCCGASLATLLPVAAIERIIELFLVQRADSSWSKDAVTLLRLASPASAESAFQHLVIEQDARKRLALVRLAAKLGPESIRLACKYLTDERWYVVRNMCRVLAEVGGCEVIEHIAPALEHPDARVQQAALKALVNSRTVTAAPVLAAALTKLAPEIRDDALDELLFLRHVKTIGHLEEFVKTGSGSLAAAQKAVQVLAAIDDDEALKALGRIAGREKLDSRIQQAALSGIANNPSPEAASFLAELVKSHDSLPQEMRAQLKFAAKACGESS